MKLCIFSSRIGIVTQRVTMRDVAARAGVHHSTVSLCLKDHPRIPAATKERILRIARELGYCPDPHTTALMQSRRKKSVGNGSPTIAFVTFSPTPDGWRKWIPELQDGLESAQAQAQARGFRVEEIWAPPEKVSPRRLGEILYTRGITGVLLSPLPEPVETLDWDWGRLAVVALGPSLLEPRVHRVRNNHFQSMLTVMDECHRLGYRRVGLALKEEVSRRMGQRWLAAYLLRQQQLGMTEPEPLLATEWRRDVFLSWIRQARPDAVIAINMREVTQWLHSAGFRIPEDVGLVSLSAPRSGRLSGVFQDWPAQGKRAVNLLIDLLYDHRLGLDDHPNLLIVSSRWNPGETVGRLGPERGKTMRP